MTDAIPVVDLFAGPGGLNEGFARVGEAGKRTFKVVASVEMDARAVETLTMRGAARKLFDDGTAQQYLDFLRTPDVAGRARLESDKWFKASAEQTKNHTFHFELATETRRVSDEFLKEKLSGLDEFVLLGGPPCQAYSLAGRSRRVNDPNFAADKKHFLFKEYLHILHEFKPAVFVMENVKGMLSAGHGGSKIFDLIMDDPRSNGLYTVRSMVVDSDDPQPDDFLMRAEQYGVPQRRHRVIIIGIRNDIAFRSTVVPRESRPVTVWETISGLPRVTSRVSRVRGDQEQLWNRALVTGLSAARRQYGEVGPLPPQTRREELDRWLQLNRGVPLSLHEPRSHMATDLSRYAYLASAALHGHHPKVYELPQHLQPQHQNMAKGTTTPFPDRFLVQDWHRPSSTVASHISKDGHHYIHPDPQQMRSLTVREAARLQTFPDDYFFCGSRTSQFHQVGNAVPPLLAHKIALKVAEILGR